MPCCPAWPCALYFQGWENCQKVVYSSTEAVNLKTWQVSIMLEYIQNFLAKSPKASSIYLTLVLFIIYNSVKYILTKGVERSKGVSEDDKAISKKRIRDYGRILLMIALFSLWFSQLQAVFVSLLAFAAAIVLAFKEVIMCITGGIVNRINKPFKNGDRIEVDGIRGFVLEKTMTATRVLELGPERSSQQTTGNIITIPNSVFLTKSAVNESYFHNYSIRTFTLSPVIGIDLELSEKALIAISKSISSSYLDSARESISNFCKKEGIHIPSIEPRIKILLSELNEAKLLLKMPVHNKNVGDIEQKLFREYHKFITENQILPSGSKQTATELG